MAGTVPPSVKAVNHVVGAPVESHVLLECVVEVTHKNPENKIRKYIEISKKKINKENKIRTTNNEDKKIHRQVNSVVSLTYYIELFVLSLLKHVFEYFWPKKI